MNDKELEEYIKTINPDFTSYIEKGTIEMKQEYYNLLEERMARLINENQELKREKEKLIIENNLIKSLLANNNNYTYGIR